MVAHVVRLFLIFNRQAIFFFKKNTLNNFTKLSAMEGLMILNIFFILLPDICTYFEGNSITLFLVWGFVIFLLSHKSHYVFYRVHTSGGL